MLTLELNKGPLKAMQSSGDADLDIVKTALDISTTAPTCVIGEDTDLLIYLIYHGHEGNQIYFKSEKKTSSQIEPKLWDIRHVQNVLGPETCKGNLLIHALLGSDTTS